MKKLIIVLTVIGLLVFAFQATAVILSFWQVPGSMEMVFGALLAALPFALLSVVMVVVLMANRGLFDRPWRQILQVGWVLIALAQIILLLKG